jgi:hypothetical protein
MTVAVRVRGRERRRQGRLGGVARAAGHGRRETKDER